MAKSAIDVFSGIVCLGHIKIACQNEIITSLPWQTILGSFMKRFANDFHSWLRHSWKLLTYRLTPDPKIVTHGNSCIINLCINILHARINTVRPRQNGLHFPDDIFKYIFINENCCILTRFSFELVTKDPINNVPALVQIMDWHRPGDRPYSEPMVVS